MPSHGVTRSAIENWLLIARKLPAIGWMIAEEVRGQEYPGSGGIPGISGRVVCSDMHANGPRRVEVLAGTNIERAEVVLDQKFYAV